MKCARYAPALRYHTIWSPEASFSGPPAHRRRHPLQFWCHRAVYLRRRLDVFALRCMYVSNHSTGLLPTCGKSNTGVYASVHYLEVVPGGRVGTPGRKEKETLRWQRGSPRKVTCLVVTWYSIATSITSNTSQQRPREVTISETW